MTSRGIKIPLEQLSAETLQSVIEEYVTRDGTNLVDADTKMAQVERQLRSGHVELWFDERTRSCNILAAER